MMRSNGWAAVLVLFAIACGSDSDGGGAGMGPASGSGGAAEDGAATDGTGGTGGTGDAGVPCGTKDCNPGEICCDGSCGLCALPTAICGTCGG